MIGTYPYEECMPYRSSWYEEKDIRGLQRDISSDNRVIFR